MKNQNFGKKSNFCQKIKLLSHNQIFVTKSIFSKNQQYNYERLGKTSDLECLNQNFSFSEKCQFLTKKCNQIFNFSPYF